MLKGCCLERPYDPLQLWLFLCEVFPLAECSTGSLPGFAGVKVGLQNNGVAERLTFPPVEQRK